MSAGRKKVIVRMLGRAWLAGYLPPQDFADEHALQLLSLEAKMLSIQNEEVKWVSFIRDFTSGGLNEPEQMLRQSFSGRPRGAGLWIRLQLKDGDAIEGIAENHASLVTGPGIFFAPPDMRGNTQRVWVPRTSIAAFELLAVLGGSPRRPATQALPVPNLLQEPLFAEEPEGGAQQTGTLQSPP